MADVFDQAQERDALNLQDAIAAQRAKAASTQKLQPEGCCLNPRCAEPFEDGDTRLFCCAGCERERARLVRN